MADSYVISMFAERCMPYRVKTSCGHEVLRKMRPATAGVAWSEDVVLAAPNGRPCDECCKTDPRYGGTKA